MSKDQWNTDRRKAIGHYGETLACRSYERAGFRIIERQFSCRFGEIDLIAEKGNVLHFVEVRTKTGGSHDPLRYGTAEESITMKKRQTIRKVTEYFLNSKSFSNKAVQFDVISILIDKKEKKAWIKRYPQAF